MVPESDPGPERPDPHSVVAGAIQDLVATRLARGFLPLAGLFAAGLVGLVGAAPQGLATAAGALATGAAMLSYGLSTVRGALGRPRRAWQTAAGVGSVVPTLYGLYVLGWLGLRPLARPTDALGVAIATLYVALGVWVLRSWMRVVEVRRLARVMASNIDGHGESP